MLSQETRHLFHFQIFSWAWACASLFDLGKWNRWLATPGDFLVFLASCAVLLRPSSVSRFTLLAALQTGVTLWQLPFVSNHTALLCIIDLTLLGSVVWVGLKSGGLGRAQASLFETFAPVLRVELILLYAVVAFHKLNTDWFDPEVSCGVTFQSFIFRPVSWLNMPTWTYWVSIALGIGVEFALGLSLSFRRTRPVALVAGGVFHLILGLVGFYRFSALMYALYLLCLSDGAIDRIRTLGELGPIRRLSATLRRGRFSLENLRRAATLLLVVLSVVVLVRQPWRESSGMSLLVRDFENDLNEPWLSFGFRLVWIVWSVAMLAGFVWVVRAPRLDDRSDGDPARARLTPIWLWAFPLLLLLNGMSPYLGLKTDSSFSMFSNLRTSGPGSNHLLVTQPLRLLPYADDLVRIEESSDAQLRKIASENYQIPWFELTSYVSYRAEQGKDFSLTYEREGVRHQLPSVRQSLDLFPQPPWIPRKLLYYRPVFMGKSCKCTH